MKQLHLSLFFVASLTMQSLSFGAFVPSERPYDALHYGIHLTIDPKTNPKDFKAETEVSVQYKTPSDLLTLDIEQLNIEAVTGVRPFRKALDFKIVDGKILAIQLPRQAKTNEKVVVSIKYAGVVQEGHHGFFKVQDPDEPDRGPMLFTHFEPLTARSFYPCHDEPYDKATTEVWVTVPAAYEVVSNGWLVKDRKWIQNGKGTHEMHWKLDKPQATYLLSVAIAPFAKVTDGKNKKPELTAYVGKTKADRAKYVLDVTRQTLNFYEGYLSTPYPWPKYASVGLPTFLWGGMENTSSTHMNEERILLHDPASEYEKGGIRALAAHELAHQWFGDYVTMKWWDDVWLNESFASYMTLRAMKAASPTEEAEVGLVADTWNDYFRQEDGPRSHPIVDVALQSADDAFDAINYTKGENVLRMLNFYMGEQKFKQGLKTYLKKYGYSNANYRDFFASMEGAAGESLSNFRDSWLLQRGYPILSYGGEWKKDDSTYELTVSQKPNHTEDKSLFKFRVPVIFHRKSTPQYDKEMMVEVTSETKKVAVPLLAEPEWVTVNPGAVVLAKVTQQNRDEDILSLQAQSDPDPIARMWAAFELMPEIRKGKEMSSLARTALATIIKSDPSPYVRIAVIANLNRMQSRYFPEQIATAMMELFKTSSAADFTRQPQAIGDPHGWKMLRTESIGSLGKIQDPGILKPLQEMLSQNTLPLDDLDKAAHAVAVAGLPQSSKVLKQALHTHQDRGYRYKFFILYAFGALEDPSAAKEIKDLSDTAGSDFFGRIGFAVRDNQTLKNSPEWAQFLGEFVLQQNKFGDEVKSRILSSIDEVKTPSVREMLQTIAEKASSERIREISKKILKKNFES